MPAAGRSEPATLLVDSHVHFYNGFDPEVFFESAGINFARAARNLDLRGPWSGALMMAETSECHFFDSLKGAAIRAGSAWTIAPTAEEVSLVAERDGAPRLFIIAGRQIATAEGLEILSLATLETYRDGATLAESVSGVRKSGALLCLPWGFGKWWFKRRDLVADLIRQEDPRNFFLGDNGCRPRGAPDGKIFSLATELKVRFLAGSDPLPIPGHARRVGSYGCLLSGGLDSRRPAAALVKALVDENRTPRIFGSRRAWYSFLSDQFRLRTGPGLGRPQPAPRSTSDTDPSISSGKRPSNDH